MTLSSGSTICFKSSHNSGKLWHLPVYHKGSNKNTDEQSDEEGNKARQAICAQSMMISLDFIPSWHLYLFTNLEDAKYFLSSFLWRFYYLVMVDLIKSLNQG